MSQDLYQIIKDIHPSPYRLIDLQKGEILFHENEVCEDIGIIVEGEVSISSYSYHGEEIIYNLLGENEVFGNNLLFSSDPHYRGNILAKKASKVALISKNNLLFLLQNNQDFLLEYLNIQSDFGKRLNAIIKLLSFNNAEERFLYYLFLNGNDIHYSNVTSLAKQLFLQRETLSRLLSSMEKRHQIKRSKKRIILLAHT